MTKIRVAVCEACNGTGVMYWMEPHYEYVTRDMATDACDPQLEGQEIQWGEEECHGECPDCKGTGQVVNQ